MWRSRPLSSSLIFLKNGPTWASFLFIFGFFKQAIKSLQQINAKKVCPYSKQHQDSNPHPLEHEPSPITTRPGHPPHFLLYCFLSNRVNSKNIDDRIWTADLLWRKQPLCQHCHSHSPLRNFYMAFLKRWLAHGSGTFCRVVTFDILFNQFSTELDKRMPIGVGNIPF